MKFQTLNKYNKVLRILYFKKVACIRDLEKVVDLSYNTLNYTLNSWVEEGFVKKSKKVLLLLGGDRFEFSLTEEGEKFVKELISEEYE